MSKPGELYVFRASLPDGYAVAPHTHPMDEHVTVIQGTMMLGLTLPSNVPHFNRMKGETILQFHGIGPYDIIYVDAEDDPSRQ
jgi:hypothetical protein